jgi:hypothetical protein
VALLSLAWLLACGSPTPPASTYGAGARLPRATLFDQFGVEHTLDESLGLVLFSRDMDGGAILREVLARDPDALQKLRAVYVADISGMPGVIANTMAVPRMRKRPYPTLLDRDGEVSAAFPSRPGNATLIWLEQLRVRAVLHVESVPQLREAIGVAPDG